MTKSIRKTKNTKSYLKCARVAKILKGWTISVLVRRSSNWKCSLELS